METEKTNLERLIPSDPAPYRNWIRAGFFSALGVALLTLLALVVMRLTQATLDIIVPFAIAMVLALLLDPLADRLETEGLGRAAAVALVFGFFLVVLVAVSSLAIPALINQTDQLTQNGPQYIANLRGTVNDFLVHHPKIAGVKMPRNFDALSAQFSTRASELLSNSTGKLTTILLGSISTLLDTIIVLIVTFYLLLDIDRLRARLFFLLPERMRGPMDIIAHDIGRVFSEYLRGLLIVSLLYGLATLGLLFGLSLWHHDMASYALLVGVAGGLLYSVPYLGPLITGVITFLVAFAAGGIGFGVWAVGLTLGLNTVFDNVITPRIVGGGVGLHPVASLFALTLGGALFGLWGLLLSVPIAASIQAILFRLFPKLTAPTPPAFLRAQGIRPDDGETSKTLRGDEADASP